ncbi:MAG: hypothetical protein OEV66_12790 [Spirochaetia bacterium]|nr:hypothetical protein [Spirochaetia bacterium]
MKIELIFSAGVFFGVAGIYRRKNLYGDWVYNTAFLEDLSILPTEYNCQFKYKEVQWGDRWFESFFEALEELDDLSWLNDDGAWVHPEYLEEFKTEVRYRLDQLENHWRDILLDGFWKNAMNGL